MGMFKKPSSILIILMAAIGLFLSACGGGTPTPTPTPDPCSAAYLIAAINNANATPATEDTIDLSPGCLYELTSVDNFTDGSNGLPSIVSTIVIKGNGATIQRSFTSGTPAFRIFHVSNIGMVTLNDLTVSNGLAVAATTRPRSLLRVKKDRAKGVFIQGPKHRTMPMPINNRTRPVMVRDAFINRSPFDDSRREFCWSGSRPWSCPRRHSSP